MNAISDYFNTLAESIHQRFVLSGISGHPSDAGSNREELLQDFINNHTPDRYSCDLGGKIIGLHGSLSKQMDCVVSSDIVPKFDIDKRTLSIVESVGMAISVKSMLDKDKLFDCLDNLASIPQLSENAISQTSAITHADYFNKLTTALPSLLVWSYDGISLDTLHKHLLSFYASNTSIPENRKPSAILVNKKYIIKRSALEMTKLGGSKIPPNTFYPFRIEHVPGMALASIIAYLSDATSWLNEMNVNFSLYLDEAFIG